jgi:SAM-dependent methyltransferase
MDYKFKKENHDFWVERLKENNFNQVCTNDVALDQIESNQILSKISNNKSILEIGCGNGLLYEDLKKKFSLSKYVGTDFVNELVDECDSKKIDGKDTFLQLDMTEVNTNTFNSKFDFIISKRAIQNVIDHKLQIEAIDNFGYFLDNDGLMVLVESSSDAQHNINNERKKYDLGHIDAPFHNLFFDDEQIRSHNFKNVKLLNIDPFSSDFYFITRIIYARYAKEYLNENPNYSHPLQKIALTMDGSTITKDFSQIKCYTFIKK